MDKKLLEFFNGDELASRVWYNKYRFDNEVTPNDMFKRHADEILKILDEKLFDLISDSEKVKKLTELSGHGYLFFMNLLNMTSDERKEYLLKYLNFDNIVLGGSMMQGIGNRDLYSSLSNCFVVGAPHDSYAGIGEKGDQMAQVMKRRGGAGLELSTIRPKGAKVHNQAKTSSGVVIFAERYSNITIEVAQDGRRGALMLSLDIRHPDSFEFIVAKQDLSRITGANISVGVDDDFMEAVESDSDFILRWPIENSETRELTDISGISPLEISKAEYGVLMSTSVDYDNAPTYWKKIKAKEYWQTLINCAWKTAEPGILFIGNWRKRGLDWPYVQYRPISTNPCSEIPMQPFDACRLVAYNCYNLVNNPFEKNAYIDDDNVFNVFYLQMFIGDLLVDLEFEYIDRILYKISTDSLTPDHLKKNEFDLWTKIKETAKKGRRVGAGFTAIGDMMAALDEKYTNIDILKNVFKNKMKAELNCTIDMGILFGTFDGWSPDIESIYEKDFISIEFPEEYHRMKKYGRRNISWSTGAPTGTTSMMTQTTSGIEPMFRPYYKRRKKCLTENDRVDYIDPADKQKYSEYLIVHHKFEVWLNKRYGLLGNQITDMSEIDMVGYYMQSPWYKNSSEDIGWRERVMVQQVVQNYTTHAISSTINLPEDVKEEVIGNIYMESWKSGLKGNTVYREGSRSGILISNEPKTVNVEPAPKRPRFLDAHYYTIKQGKKLYSIIVGFLNEIPYEIFILSGIDNLPEVIDFNEHITGEVRKDSKDWYDFVSDTFTVREISDMENEEKLLSLMLSGLMSQGTPLTRIIKIINKSKPFAGSFTHKLVKILSRYVIDGETYGETCPKCGGELIYQDGCVLCVDCGDTKC